MVHPSNFNPKQNILDEQLATSGIHNNFLDDFFEDAFEFVGDIFTGGGVTANKNAKKQADAQNEAMEAAYKFEGEELKRLYEFEKDSLAILKRNTETNLRAQERRQDQNWQYGMAIRDYEYAQQMRAYSKSKATFNAQVDFNEIAESFAIAQQDRYLQEKQIEIALDEKSNLLDYVAVTHGLGLQKRKVKQAAAAQLRETNIEALKTKGASAARGQAGRTAVKNLQAITAEFDAKERDIIDALMTDQGKIDLDLMARQQELNMEEFAFEMTENNLFAADQFTRQKIAMDRLQADLNAKANLMYKPMQVPPIPKPIALPRPEYQEVYEPKQGPMGARVIAPQQNIAASIAGSALSFVAGGGGFTGGKFDYGKAFASIF